MIRTLLLNDWNGGWLSSFERVVGRLRDDNRLQNGRCRLRLRIDRYGHWLYSIGLDLLRRLHNSMREGIESHPKRRWLQQTGLIQYVITKRVHTTVFHCTRILNSRIHSLFTSQFIMKKRRFIRHIPRITIEKESHRETLQHEPHRQSSPSV